MPQLARGNEVVAMGQAPESAAPMVIDARVGLAPLEPEGGELGGSVGLPKGRSVARPVEGSHELRVAAARLGREGHEEVPLRLGVEVRLLRVEDDHLDLLGTAPDSRHHVREQHAQCLERRCRREE